MTHKLKTWPQFFQAVKSGIKPFEIRTNDRNFQTGDTLILEEFAPCPACKGTRRLVTPGGGGDREQCWECLEMPEGGIYTGEALVRTVTYLTDFSQSHNRVVMGLGCLPHKFWGAGELECPKDIKAPNGELHTLKCKVCGEENPRTPMCSGLVNKELSC